MALSKNNNLNWAHPLVRDWFLTQFSSPSEPQIQGWPHILSGKTTLIAAPTGSGKTLAAFLVCIDSLVRKSLAGELSDQTEVLYVSPLKALSNDIQKNLLQPLAELSDLASERGLSMAKIEVAVRTGDTPARERQAMLKKPPHILVTTPESLYILLTAEKSREILKNVKTVIVDEIHALINDKRGSHLALSLERLNALTAKPPLRIGLSATQKPMEITAQFLAGSHASPPIIVNVGHLRKLDLAIEIPEIKLSAVTSHEMWDEIYAKIVALAEPHRSTLVFVNTRRLAEKIAHQLTLRLGDQVAAHHGSLSRKSRLAVEAKLKSGELKILVATASLELGIDIGMIDLVCQIGSPRAIAVALQRTGRAGHWHGAIPKGRIFATTRDELVECAALVDAIHQGDLDQFILPNQPIDILAQQIVATCASNDWKEDELFQLVTGAFPYKNLCRNLFNDILEMLSAGIAGSRGRYGSYLFRDQVNGLVKARRGARLTAIMNGGAIPENGLFSVIAEATDTMVGTLDEDFAVESNRGDIILLGTHSWRVQRVESTGARVIVEDAHGAPPSVPFWRGEAPARTSELSAYVAKVRQKISDMQPNQKSIAWCKKQYRVSESAATQLFEYIHQGKAILGKIPSQTTIVAERFFDEAGGMQLIIHAPFGARINKAWGLALRKCFCRSFNFELQAAATDDGLNISLAEQHSFPLADVFRFLHSETLQKTLTQAVLQSPLFNTRWRWSAARSLALLRYRNGKKIPPHISRMLADDLLAAVFPDAAACQDNLAGREIELPNHPLITETMKDIFESALDIAGLAKLLHRMKAGEIECHAIDTPLPSPFAHEILNANPYAFLDDAPLEERRARAVEMRRVLPENILKEAGKLDAQVIQEVQEQIWPDIRNIDELHDVLQTLIALPAEKKHHDFFNVLVATGRAGIAVLQSQTFWFATEKAKAFAIIYPAAKIQHELPDITQKILSREEAITQMLREWLAHLGPTTASELNARLLLDMHEIEQALLTLEVSGQILRGHFRETNSHTLEWCDRRLLARIHWLTVQKLRKEIAPVALEQFVHWLLRWQHLAPNTQVRGEQGLLEVVQQLQGFEMPASVWEQEIFKKRVADYDGQMLDRLNLAGIIGWGRLNPDLSKKARATRAVPISFFLREETAWLQQKSFSDENCKNLSEIAKKIYLFLKTQGASFFSDIVRGVGHLKTEIETALWELVAAGMITADGFDNLRALINPKRRSAKRNRAWFAPSMGGRWTIFHYGFSSSVTEQQVEAICWILLRRYGVVFRDLLFREKNIPRWRELLLVFRRLEDRGEIRAGRFVNGVHGEQFALPVAVSSLRALRDNQQTPSQTLTIAAVDPLNLLGTLLPGVRVPAISNKKVQLSFNRH
jgi:ATP-dependent Lhr-like helicase